MADKSKYYVIEFEKLPTAEHDKYVCVPHTWVLGLASDKIGFKYPLEKNSITNNRILNSEPSSDNWPMYMELVKYKTDNYTNAKQFRSLMEKSYTKTRRRNSRVNSKCNKTPTTKQKARRESHDNHNTDEEMYESEDEKVEDEQLLEKSIPYNKSAEKINRSDPRNDRRCNPGGSKDNQNTDNPSSNTKLNDSNVIQTINATLQDLSKEMKRQNENIEKLNKHFEVAREASLISAVMLKEIAKKLMIDSDQLNINTSVMESKTQAAQQSQMITQRRRSVRIQEEQNRNEDVETPKRQYIRPFSLPREYYEAKDSKWTLRYREMASGLEELMKDTGVYIDSIRFANCKRLARDEKTLARLLLVEIFTDQALGTCSLTGARAKAFDPDGTNTRPGLDERARNVLLNFVEEYCHERRWVSSERQSIMNTLRNKMQEIRSKYVK